MADTPKPAPSRYDALALFELRGPPTLPGLDLPELRRPERPLVQHPGAFDLALEQGTNDGGGYAHQFLGRVCLRAVRIFGGDTLGRQEIVLRAAELRLHSWRGERVDPRQSVEGWLDAGNMIHHGIRVGQVEQVVGEDGEPRWRLLSQEPVWVLEGRPERSVQARGLPPREQAKRDRLEKRRAKKLLDDAVTAADKSVASAIEDVLHADAHALIPAELVACGGLPESFQGEQIAAARPTLQYWHRDRELGIEGLTLWTAHWRDMGSKARLETKRRAMERSSTPIPPEDAAAIGDLAW